MARAKLSYAPPQPNIWVRRRGWTFDYFVEEPRDSDAARDRDADKVAEFLVEELYHGRRYTARSLEDSGKLKLPRARLRAALAALEAAGRLEERELPTDQRRGRKKHYLHCAKASGAMAAETPPEQPTPPPIAPDISIAPPYRETRNGAIDAVSVSPASLHCAKPNGAIAAQWRNSDEPATQPAEQAPDIARDNPQPPAASPKCPAKPPVCQPAANYPFRYLTKCDRPTPIPNPSGRGDPIGCSNCGARWGDGLPSVAAELERGGIM